MAGANKRNAHGNGTVRKRKDGSWEARYTSGYNSGTGKQKQMSVYGKTQKEALKKLQQIQVSVEQGTHIEPSKMTVGEWLDIWAEEYLMNIKNSTIDGYKTKIRIHIKPAIGALLLQKITPHEIQGFYNDLKRKKGLSPKTIKNTHGVLHSALSRAVKNRYIPVNPADDAILPRIEKTEVSTMPIDVIPKFIELMNKHKYGDLFYIALFTGLRQSEVLGLTWKCIDFDKGIIHIKRQLQKEKGKDGKYVLVPLKNDKPRTISPAPSVMQRLRAQKTRQLENRLKTGQAWSNPLDLVFTNELGNNLCHRTIVKWFKKIVKELGYPDLRFHDLRHTYAVNSLQSGDDVKTVQGNLGHHTAAFTLDTYGHVTEKMKQDSSDRMEQFIQSLSS